MILDTLENSARYVRLHPAFAAAFEFLRRGDLKGLAPGRHELDGARLYVSVARENGRGRDGARLEAHRKYADIQFTAEGTEWIGWRPLSACAGTGSGYLEERDIEFFTARPEVFFPVPAGSFAIFFPEDAHAPLAGDGPVRKVVVKIAV